MSIRWSNFARNLSVETAFDVLSVARKLKAQGKDVVELQIGDSPFPTTSYAKQAGIRAIQEDHSHYCPSQGLIGFREAVSRLFQREFGVPIGANQVVVTPGAKVLEQFFCEAFLDPGDSVLVFSPHFPTYPPNIERRGAKCWYVPLLQENQFRPNVKEVARFLKEAPSPRAIFLNSPHNPTGGVATLEDMLGIAELIRGKDVYVLSDEPYCHMVWKERHHSFLECPGMMDQALAVFTFSKSYSMSGWRLGFGVSSPAIVEVLSKLVNTSLSCVPPLVQLAGQAALDQDSMERDEVMLKFKRKVELLVETLQRVDGVTVNMPAGTFYVYANVARICERLGILSHGLAMYLLEGADDDFGVACLGGECFGPAGQGFLRFSCAEPDERIVQAMQFLPQAFTRRDRVARYLESHPQFRRT